MTGIVHPPRQKLSGRFEAVRARPFRPVQTMLQVVLAAAAVALFFSGEDFALFQVSLVLSYAIAIMGLNLLTGFNGQFSLGHSAFFAVGAYTAAILMDRGGMPYGPTIPVAGLVCFLFGFLFGLPALRLTGAYLAMATFALAVAMPQIIKLSVFEHWTGGIQGIVLTKPDPPSFVPLSADQWLYVVTLGVTLIMLALAVNLVDSRTGRAVLAIRENPTASRTMGIDVARYKSLIFGVSAFYTGVGGALAAILLGFVAPDSFTVELSIALVVGLVVGGTRWLPGAVFGGAFLLYVPSLAGLVSQSLSGAIYGIVLIVLVYAARSGIGGLVEALDRRLAVRRLSGAAGPKAGVPTRLARSSARAREER